MSDEGEENFESLSAETHAEVAKLGAALKPKPHKRKSSSHHKPRSKKSHAKSNSANVIIFENVAENPQASLSDGDVARQLSRCDPVTGKPEIVLDVGHGYVTYDGIPLDQNWLLGKDKGQPPKELILPDGTHTRYHRHMKLEIGTIVIDPGATVDGINESDIALGISQKLKPSLEALGFHVTVTRSAPDEAVGNRFEARREAGSSDKVMHLVIHADEIGDRQPHELSTYYSIKDPLRFDSPSRELGIALGNKMIGRHNTTLIEAPLFHGTKAILIETGNMRSPEELERLTTCEGQEAIANTLALRIHQYYVEKNPQPIMLVAPPQAGLPVIDTSHVGAPAGISAMPIMPKTLPRK